MSDKLTVKQREPPQESGSINLGKTLPNNVSQEVFEHSQLNTNCDYDNDKLEALIKKELEERINDDIYKNPDLSPSLSDNSFDGGSENGSTTENDVNLSIWDKI